MNLTNQIPQNDAVHRPLYGVTASRELVSNITDVVADEIEIWRNRPVDEVYPIVYVDEIRTTPLIGASATRRS